MLNKTTRYTLHHLGAKQRAIELGVDELMGLCEWEFRSRPRTLRRLRAEYVALAMRLYTVLGREKKSNVAADERPRRAR